MPMKKLFSVILVLLSFTTLIWSNANNANPVKVGYYENAEKIIGIPLSLITALGTVMLPRVSNLIAKGSTDKVNE